MTAKSTGQRLVVLAHLQLLVTLIFVSTNRNVRSAFPTISILGWSKEIQKQVIAK